MNSAFSSLVSEVVDPIVLMVKSNFSLTTFATWAVLGALLFAILYVIANRIEVRQQFHIGTLVVPGATLCALAAGVFGSQCGLIPPMLYAGMIVAMRVLDDRT